MSKLKTPEQWRLEQLKWKQRAEDARLVPKRVDNARAREKDKKPR